ncbi:MAG: TonB-dependent receptor [bacterium]|nr:TonB-dependent receptor [bacterium]
MTRPRESQTCKLLLAGVLLAVQLTEAPVARAQNEEETPGQTESKEKPEAEFRQEIVVTSTHPELPSAIEIPGSEIQAVSDQDLAEAMRRQDGLDAIRRGPVNLDPNVRGLVETEVGVFVDGTRTFAAGPARMDSDLSHVSPHMVERMQVVKGPYALAWGAGTLAAINLETYRPTFGTGGFNARGGVRYSDNASRTDTFGGIWGTGDSWRFNLLLNSRQGSDYEDGAGNQIPGNYESNESRLNFGFQPNKSMVIDFLIGYQEQSDIDYAGRILDASYFYTRSYGIDLTWNPANDNITEVFAQVYNNRKDHLMNNDEKPTAQPNPNRIPPFGIDVDLPTESNTAGARAHVSWGDGEWSWKAGADFYTVDQTATRSIARRDTGFVVFSDIVWPAAKIEDLGGYFQGVYRQDDFELGGTLRADLVDASAGEVSNFFADNTRGALDQSETNVSVALSARWGLSDNWALTAGVGQAVRTASVLERYSDRFPSAKFQVAAEFMGDPGIEPETGRQLDIGLQYVASRLTFTINGFYRVIDDYITVMPDPDLPRRLPLSPPVVFRYITGDEAEVVGGEFQLTHAVSDWVSWRAGISYLDGEDTFFNEPLFGLPPPSARLGVRFGPPNERYWLDLGGLLVDAQDDVAASRLEQPSAGYGVVDLMGGYQIGNGLNLRLGVENVGDKRYVNHLNSLNPFTRDRIPEMGRNIVVAIEYRP